MKHTVWLALSLAAVGIGVGVAATLRPDAAGSAAMALWDRAAAATTSRDTAGTRRMAEAAAAPEPTVEGSPGELVHKGLAVGRGAAAEPVAHAPPSNAAPLSDHVVTIADTLDGDVVEIGAFLSADILGGLGVRIETEEPRELGIALDADRPRRLSGAVGRSAEGTARSLGAPLAAEPPFLD
ncbi:MAG: hypothetical protein K9M02_02650 [Thiohalocapsa sp.]|nr:hypothetical protein [Thiohalocapsa sp.]